jgi:prophage antirepressor-like protein
MNVIPWKFRNLIIPMALVGGRLYTTTQVLAKALGVSYDAIYHSYLRNKDRLEKLNLTNCQAKEVFAQNKEAFGIKRLRADMHVWSESQMIFLAFNCRSEQGQEFSDAVIDLVIQEARANMHTDEEMAQAVTQVQMQYTSEIADMKARLDALEGATTAAASAAGTGLNAFKRAKQTFQS